MPSTRNALPTLLLYSFLFPRTTSDTVNSNASPHPRLALTFWAALDPGLSPRHQHSLPRLDPRPEPGPFAFISQFVLNTRLMGSRTMEGQTGTAPLGLAQCLLGWQGLNPLHTDEGSWRELLRSRRRSCPIQNPNEPNPSRLALAPAPAPAQLHERPGESPWESSERTAPRGAHSPAHGGRACPGKLPGLGQEHRWRPLCPLPGRARGCRLQPSGQWPQAL